MRKASDDRMHLLLEDPDEYHQLQNREIEEMIEEMKESLAQPLAPIEEQMRDYVWLSADLWSRSDLNPRNMLPASWRSLGGFADSSERLLWAADLVIVKERYGSPVEVEIVHEVLVVEGSAARQLAQLGPW